MPSHRLSALHRAASRRDFLRHAAFASSLAVIGSSAARAQSNGGAQQISTDPSDEVITMSATKLAGLIRAKKISALEAVDAYIERQIAVNDKLNAVVTNSFARARAEAKALDEKAAKGEFVGPLHGVPMTIKDSLDTEGVVSTGGTMGRQTYVPAKDATCVARVRKAGAILLGKTNTPEFTLGGLAGISTASNLLFGGSHNPYDLTRSTSGSSGGAGAIVAAGGAAFDIGSDWGGSIRGPSHNNGIAGIKPTSVRVPRTGHIVDYGGVFDLWQQLGPMCRRVEDLVLITPIISGPDYRDAACAPVPWANPAAVDLKKLRVAFCADNGGEGRGATDDDTKKTVRQAAKWLEGVVASIAEDAPTSTLKALSETRSKLTGGDAWAFYKRIADKWGTKNFSPSVTERMKQMTPISTAEYAEWWEKHDEAKSKLLEWMTAYDVFICPVSGKPAQPIDAEPGTGGFGGPGFGWQYTGVFNSTGWPSTVVRCGSSADGRLPIGLQVVCPPWREDISLAVAAYLESRSGGWQKPPV
ncbi:MAG TPA: amidase [Opitutaceae bacterium]